MDQDTDYIDLAELVGNLDPDIVFLPGYIKDSGLIIKQLKRYGINSVFLGADGWNEDMYQYGEHYIEGEYFSGFWHRDLPGVKNFEFVRRFENTYGPIRNTGIASAYDAVYLFLRASIASEPLTRESIRDSLLSVTDFDGVTGRMSFNGKRDPVKQAVILRFEDGAATFLKTVEPGN